MQAQIRIQDLIDEELKKEQDKRTTRESAHKWRPSLFGSCLRRHWYAKTGEKETNPPDARSLRVFKAGHLFHDFVQGFIDKKDIEVLIEDDQFKGFADIVTDDCVWDVKSIHSDAFWYMKKNILCQFTDGKTARVKEEEIKENAFGEYVVIRKKECPIVTRRTITILEDKLNNWLQVGWYAKKLSKQYAGLMFVSKDDLCIEEYKMSMDVLGELVDAEEQGLSKITMLPEGTPRLYGGVETKKECEYCSHLDKCKQDGNCIWTKSVTTT